MAKTPTIPYLPGYSIRPASVDAFGIATFTDGANAITPNQQQCEAYGYTYNNATGTCSAFQYSTTLESALNTETNNIQGSGNVVSVGSNNSYIMGQSNTIEESSRNNIVGGTGNSITGFINNAAVLGINGNATRQSEFDIGGGLNKITTGSDIAYADRQLAIVNLSGTTTDNTATTLTVNNQENQYINIKNNCILGWEIYITRLETGGTSGTAGKFSYRNEKGVVRIDDSYGMTFTIGYTRNIGKLGVNGSFVMMDSTVAGVPSISIQVTDRANVNNIWSASVYLHELISTNVTF
jgi:hypothetical protein